MKHKVWHYFLLVLVLLVGFKLRIHELNAPLADWHSWRQADTASVTREYVKHNYPLLAPHYHDLSSIPNGLDNPDGYRMVEFPIINWGTAQLLRAKPNLDLVATSRMVSIIFSLFGVVALYGLIHVLTKRPYVALLTAVIHATLPYTVYYSRAILPEPHQVATLLIGLWLFVVWLEHRQQKLSWVWLLLSWLSTSLSLLLKPTTVFVAPIYVWLAIRYLGFTVVTNPWLWLYGLTVAAPIAWWRHFIVQYPVGIPANEWLFNGNGIRLRPAWWRWLFMDRISRLMTGTWGVSLLVAGLVGKIKTAATKMKLFDQVSLIWAGCMFAYLVVFATGNVQHDYYQVLLTPVMAVLLARGIDWLWHLPTAHHHRLLTALVIVVVTALSYYFAWWEVRGYYGINNPAIVAAGQKVDELTPSDAKIIAPYGGDTAFLFQTNRTGWPVMGDLNHYINLGATYYVSTTLDEQTKQLMSEHTLLEQTDQYVIIEL